jgi:hypothetical protein
MTLAELELKIAVMEQDLLLLRQEVERLKGAQVIPGIGPIGTFKDDPTFAEAVRLGREYREEVNRTSLEESDRDEAAGIR